jgi:hypothetical protein
MSDHKTEMLLHAKAEVEKMKSGTMFTVEKLFANYPWPWREIPIAERVSVGLRFYHSFFDKAGGCKTTMLKMRGKTDDGQQIYQRD